MRRKFWAGRTSQARARGDDERRALQQALSEGKQRAGGDSFSCSGANLFRPRPRAPTSSSRRGAALPQGLEARGQGGGLLGRLAQQRTFWALE